jgi:hypothetical protein
MTVRIAEDHLEYIYLEHFPDAGVPDEIWIDHCAYGGSRRKRIKPICIRPRSYVVGRRLWYDVAAVEAWLEDQKVQSARGSTELAQVVGGAR